MPVPRQDCHQFIGPSSDSPIPRSRRADKLAVIRINLRTRPTARGRLPINTLPERYEIGDFIARGSLAEIYRGRDLLVERPIALKILREVYTTNPLLITRFHRGAQAASSLQHPAIVQVFDAVHTSGNHFIAMELVDGTDLRRYLRLSGALTVKRAMIIAHDVALGAGAAHHHGIVHCNVQPENVLLGRNGSIKLTGFSFSCASNSDHSSTAQLTDLEMTLGLGSPLYAAPEQLLGQAVQPTTDIYALGILMYQMLTGHPPFEADTPVGIAKQHIHDSPIPPSSLNPSIPANLEELIMRCLEKEPEKRFQDGYVLARALE